MNLLVNFFESCNEGILGKETEGRDSTVKWGGNAVRGGWCVCVGGEICENPVRFSLMVLWKLWNTCG